LLDRRVLKISVDLRSVNAGAKTIPITEENVLLPPNIQVDRIQPSEVHVQLKSPEEK
jgi:hypothetical protein